MKYFLTLATLLFTAATQAQDYRTQARQYEQRQQDNKVAEQRVHQQYLNNLPNRGPGISGNAPASAELERIFKKESILPKLTQAEEIERQLAFTARWQKDIDKEKSYEKTYGTLADSLKAAGFTYPEAYHMSRYGINGSAGNSAAILEIMSAKIALRDFKAVYPLASYEKLLQLALSYRMAGLTCISSLRKIEQRFPEKRSEIDLMVLKIMPAFYSFVNTTLDIERPTRGQSGYITDMFTTLLSKYPIEANNMADSCLESPYSTMQVKEWLKKDDLDKKAAIFIYILQAPEPANARQAYLAKDQKAKLKKLQGSLQFFRYHPAYLKELGADEWQKIEESKVLTSAEIKAYMYKLPFY